jgi:carboxypeptidase C (cathepsin A)
MVLAGHYLPTLAKYILDKQKDSTDEATKLNLKGFMVGNPYTVRPLSSLPSLAFSPLDH